MEEHSAIQAWQRLFTHILRSGILIVVCLAGTVACLEDGDAVAVQSPSPTVRLARDVRATVTPDTPRTATPVPPTPTFVPTDPQFPEPTQPVAAIPQPTQGQIVYGGEEGLNLRSEPNQQIIAALLKDSFVHIRGEARDEGGFRWWPVMIEPGWMAERSMDPAQASWLVPVDTEQIEAGRQARVAYVGKDGLNLRRTPGAEGEKLATLLQGSLVTVIGGPQQFDGVNWWQVQVAEGWPSEGAVDPSQPRWIRMQP